MLHPFAGSIEKYDEEIADPSRYRPDHCPQCQAAHGLTAHGFYSRTLVDAGFDGTIRVRRYPGNAIQPRPPSSSARYPRFLAFSRNARMRRLATCKLRPISLTPTPLISISTILRSIIRLLVSLLVSVLIDASPACLPGRQARSFVLRGHRRHSDVARHALFTGSR